MSWNLNVVVIYIESEICIYILELDKENCQWKRQKFLTKTSADLEVLLLRRIVIVLMGTNRH